jgi:hypothetical protein
VRHEAAVVRFERAGRPPSRMLRLSDRRGRAGYVAVRARLRPATIVTARARVNLIRQRLGRGKARPLIAVAGRDGTAYQAGVLRRRSGALAWAVWVKTPSGRLVGVRPAGRARTRSWSDVELRTRWSGRRVRATLRVDGRRATRTPLRRLPGVPGEGVILGLGRTSTAGETGTLLVRWARVRASAPGAGAVGPPGTPAPPPPPGPPPPAVTPVQGDFTLLPRGAALPSDAECAARVRRSSWEPRPENYEANHRSPGALSLAANPDFDARWNAAFRPRITGRFVGTTDEIIQWSACKWGLDADALRAQAVVESNWRQSTEGDEEPRSAGNCAPEDAGDPCPTSFGLLQNKWYYNRAAYPMLRTMTSFHMDWSGAKLRGCYEGMKGVPGGDIWGCLREWYSGSWNGAGGGAYVARVQDALAERAWLRWTDGSGGIPYSTGLAG